MTAQVILLKESESGPGVTVISRKLYGQERIYNEELPLEPDTLSKIMFTHSNNVKGQDFGLAIIYTNGSFFIGLEPLYQSGILRFGATQ